VSHNKCVHSKKKLEIRVRDRTNLIVRVKVEIQLGLVEDIRPVVAVNMPAVLSAEKNV